MEYKSIEKLLEHAYEVISVLEFEELMKNDNVKACKFAGCRYIGDRDYPITKHLILFTNGESMYIYEDMPCI